MDKQLVSVIIVNYRDYTHLYNCLTSLRTTLTYNNLEIIVVDNESNLTLLNDLQSKFQEVQFFPLKENLNYAEGNNYGIAKSKGDFIVLLNNDTTVETNWLEPLIREGSANPRAFYQPKIFLLDKNDTIFSLGCKIHLFGHGFPIGIGKHISEVIIPEEKVEVFYCVGACVFTSRETLIKVGGMDSNYWTYYEDVNLGWKGRLVGCPSYLVPDSTIYHKWGGSYGQQLSQKKLYLLERGRLSSVLRNYSVRSILLLFPAMLFFEFFLILYLLRKGLVIPKVHASLDVLRNLSTILHERGTIQSTRLCTDKDISLFMSVTIEHPYIRKLPYVAERLLTWLSKKLMNIL